MNILPKNILIVVYGGLGGGNFNEGVPVIQSYIQELAKSNNISIVSCLKTNYIKTIEIKRFYTLNTNLQTKRIWSLLKLFFFLIKYNFKYKVDLIYTIGGYPNCLITQIIARIFKIKSAIILLGGELVYFPKIKYGVLKNKINIFISSRVYNKVTYLICLSQFQANFSYKLINRKVDIIPFGVESNYINSIVEKNNDSLKILNISNINSIKNHDLLLDIFGEIILKKKAILTIIGDGPNKNDIIEKINKKKLTQYVFVLGAIPNYKLIPYYQSHDFFIITSIYDAQAITISESFANGCVVCGTNIGLIPELHNYCCYGFKNTDYAKMAEEFIELSNNLKFYKILQKNAFEWTKKNTIEKSIHEFNKLINC